MHADKKSGDLSVRIHFGLVMGTSSDAGKVRPSISITCETSGQNLEIDLTPEQLVAMLGGSAALVSADKVSGFKGLGKWGKYMKNTTRIVATRVDDYVCKKPRELPHLASVIAEMEAEGWQVDAPRRNNGGKWVLVGRKYEDTP